MQEFLDYAHLQSMAEITGGRAYRVIDRFATGLPDEIKRLPALMAQSGRTALRAEIHRLKGSAVTCGFKGLADCLHAFDPTGDDDFQRLESCARESIAEWRSFRNTITA